MIGIATIRATQGSAQPWALYDAVTVENTLKRGNSKVTTALTDAIRKELLEGGLAEFLKFSRLP